MAQQGRPKLRRLYHAELKLTLNIHAELQGHDGLPPKLGGDSTVRSASGRSVEEVLDNLGAEVATVVQELKRLHAPESSDDE